MTQRPSLEQELIRQLSGSKVGQPASEAVKAIVNSTSADADAVRRALRTLLESGKIHVGPNLNLIVPK